jgi:hypothetical protein
MSIHFSQAKLKGEERRAILQAIETQMQQVIIDGVTQVRKRVSGAGSHDQTRTLQAQPTPGEQPAARNRSALCVLWIE